MNKNMADWVTITLIQKAVSSFVKDLNGNGIKFRRVPGKTTTFKVENTNKCKMAIRMVRERFGMQSISVVENLNESKMYDKYTNALGKGLNKLGVSRKAKTNSKLTGSAASAYNKGLSGKNINQSNDDFQFINHQIVTPLYESSRQQQKEGDTDKMNRRLSRPQTTPLFESARYDEGQYAGKDRVWLVAAYTGEMIIFDFSKNNLEKSLKKMLTSSSPTVKKWRTAWKKQLGMFPNDTIADQVLQAHAIIFYFHILPVMLEVNGIDCSNVDNFMDMFDNPNLPTIIRLEELTRELL